VDWTHVFAARVKTLDYLPPQIRSRTAACMANLMRDLSCGRKNAELSNHAFWKCVTWVAPKARGTSSRPNRKKKKVFSNRALWWGPVSLRLARWERGERVSLWDEMVVANPMCLSGGVRVVRNPVFTLLSRRTWPSLV
jgi:hypothetical protein